MIHIVSDTSTMYTPEQGKQLGTTIVPLHVTINDRSYRDLEDINDVMLLDMIADKHVPKTSQPALGEKIDAYDELSSTGEVLDIAMSSGLSGTYQSALLAKDQCSRPEKVHVFDSRTLCGPHRIMFDVALRMAKSRIFWQYWKRQEKRKFPILCHLISVSLSEVADSIPWLVR